MFKNKIVSAKKHFFIIFNMVIILNDKIKQVCKIMKIFIIL